MGLRDAEIKRRGKAECKEKGRLTIKANAGRLFKMERLSMVSFCLSSQEKNYILRISLFALRKIALLFKVQKIRTATEEKNISELRLIIERLFSHGDIIVFPVLQYCSHNSVTLSVHIVMDV